MPGVFGKLGSNRVHRCSEVGSDRDTDFGGLGGKVNCESDDEAKTAQ